MKMDAWDAKFGFFWYNDEEIFNFTPEDFDAKAKGFADSGINTVITFSCTHFRWSFKEHWDKITACLAQIVRACHKYGIKVVEHHSSHLTFDPLDGDDWDYMERVLNKRKSSIGSWEGIMEFVGGEIPNGTEGYRQIDGRTGKWARSNYKGWCMCFNNPGYRREYFDYLETLYKQTGIDGIMCDDVQYFARGHACACGYCAEKFKVRTGYDMPQPGDEWNAFYGDYDNPAYLAWEKFRRASTIEFQEAVNEHFKGLGLDLLRPNYVSTNITRNWSAYPFEEALHLWDWVFQENCFSFVIRHSWPSFLTESVHRYNMGRIKGVPSMSMFYPDRPDSFYFSWALATSWGQLFTGTPEGMDMSSLESRFRSFEKKYRTLLFDQKKKADVTIYWSYDTANYCDAENCSHTTAVKSWTQALVFAGYSIDMIFASEEVIDPKIHTCLLVSDVMMMDEKEFAKINRFASGGGTVIYTGDPGVRKPDGTPRTKQERIKLLSTGVPVKKDRWSTEFKKGEGKIITYGETPLDDYCYEPHSVDRWENTSLTGTLPEYKADRMAARAERLIGAHAGKSVVPEEYHEMVNYYRTFDSSGENVLIHIVNAMGTVDSGDKAAGHDALIPAFLDHGDKDFHTVIRIKGDCSGQPYLISPEFEGGKKLSYSKERDAIRVEIPEGLFAGYAAVVVPTGGAKD
jgi:hypothetical protein